MRYSSKVLRCLVLAGVPVMPSQPLLAGTASPNAARQSPSSGQVIITPDILTDEKERSLAIKRGLVFVPENRSKPNSRLIAVHFIVFPAAQTIRNDRPPVFLLPGGPGWDIDFSDPLWFDEVERLRATREVIYVSQRGFFGAPGLNPDLRVTFPARAAQPTVPALTRALQDQETLRQAFKRWEGSGVDLSGYDILNITADVDDVRRALGHQKIVLRGCSFGSQWALAYMARWPGTVDRALISGVEPLNYGDDSPDWIWASMKRVAESAEQQPQMVDHIPKGGTMVALQTVIGRLEANPVSVPIRNPRGQDTIIVSVGADDLRSVLTDLSLGRRRSLENLAEWPRFILEMYSGDYRFLAARIAEARLRDRTESLLLATVNHSVDGNADREARLLKEPAAKWLGNINLKDDVTRSVAPTPQVDDSFRQERSSAIPMLLISGDYDWSTPIENAVTLAKTSASTRVVTVEGGRHCTETNYGEMSVTNEVQTKKLYGFIDQDLTSGTTSYFASLPHAIKLPPIKFTPPSDRSLYDEWLSRKR